MAVARSPSLRSRDDGNKSAGWRKSPFGSSTQPKAKPWEVTPADLDRLDAVRALLAALNDAYVSASRIEELIDEIPVLKARILRHAAGEIGAPTGISVAEALMRAGNLGFESELLGLLEDLTLCRADLEEQNRLRKSGD